MTAPTSIQTEIQKLAPSAVIELFQLDASSFGGGITYFHAGTNDLMQRITWQGQDYEPFPVQMTGFEATGNGQLPRPILRVANITGLITALVLLYDDLLGAKVTRKRTMLKFLDAVNFGVRRNLLRYTEQFDNASAGTQLNVNVTANATIAPDGTLAADKIIETSATGEHKIYREIGNIVPVNTICTWSVFVKAAERSWFILNTATGGTNNYTWFDVGNGAVGTVGASRTASIKHIGNGWYRCSVTGSTSSLSFPSSTYIQYQTSTGNNAATFSGTTSVGLFLWGAQLEPGETATEYQPIAADFLANPTADPTAEFDDDVYFIDRKSSETREVVEFELAAAIDLQGVMLPRRQIIQNVCPWKYRSSECSYAGTDYFSTNDAPVSAIGQDVCGKRLSSCKLRFGAFSDLPYGGFPSAGLIK